MLSYLFLKLCIKFLKILWKKNLFSPKRVHGGGSSYKECLLVPCLNSFQKYLCWVNRLWVLVAIRKLSGVFLLIADTCLVTSMGVINVGPVIFLEQRVLVTASNVRAVSCGFKSPPLINLLPILRRSRQIERVGYCRKVMYKKPR